MSSLRIARAALRASRPASAIARPVQRRGYADVASDKIKLSLALPHQVRSFPSRDRVIVQFLEDICGTGIGIG
jgi:F-type H+-transporting ATPase subunit delta